MTDITPANSPQAKPAGIWRSVARRFNLHSDKADDQIIDSNIRAGVRLSGSNLWALICAIFLASIGLNVNSASAIIGAMLISPLMGPIVGVGYGVGIYDFALIKRSLKNLAIATSVSLLTSTTYFLLSPLGQAQSELLARTSPTIWDVLIAFIGGLVGVVGATRKDKGNVIPGVAIATALMPPLCTAGFGLAHGNWQFMLGAFYLFSINSVFIAFATILVVWIIRPQHIKAVDNKTQRYLRHSIWGIVAVTVVPSIYLAYQLVTQELYQQRVRQFVQHEMVFEHALVADTEIDAQARQIRLKLVGSWVNDEQLLAAKNKLANYQLLDSDLKITQAGNKPLDLKALRASLLSENHAEQRQQTEREALIHNLQQQLQQQQVSQQAQQTLFKAIISEVQAQYPELQSVKIATIAKASQDGEQTQPDYLLVIESSAALNLTELQRLQRGLNVRLQPASVDLLSHSKQRSEYLPAAKATAGDDTDTALSNPSRNKTRVSKAQ